MATAILSSRNSLNHRFDHQTLLHRNPNSRLRRHPHAAPTAPRRINRSSTVSQSKTLVVSPATNTNLVMGQVKILKRGETLSAFRSNCANQDSLKQPVLSDVDVILDRIGPEPETVHKQIGAGLEMVFSVDYAGASSSVSPPPSSLPIPCFLEKNN